jgi:hypothetical protein
VTQDIQAGETYSFKVSASNVVGTSELTDSVSIIAATIPDQVSPAPYKHEASTSSITIRWTEPNDGGSEITFYTVEWDEGRGNDQYYLLGETNF